ncbi:amidohydrolase [Chloroflexi bacterium TSY]|nr:amidohydrolase [Chloroflexi bacterium TSY]
MYADLVMTNGNIRTMDRKIPQVDALAISGSRILAMGGNAEISTLLKAGGRTIDLNGRLVLPGFIDAHIHFMSYGLSLQEIDLAGVPSLALALERVAARAAKTPPDQWLIGRGWDQVQWGTTFPTRHDLDCVAPERPIFLRRKCGHVGWANSRAMKLGNISKTTPDPAGGEIDRDPATGEPTGIFKERAMQLIADLQPAATEDQALDAVRRAISHVHKMGIVGVHNMEDAQALRAFQRLRKRGELSLRLLQQIPEVDLDAAIQVGIHSGFGDDWIRIGAVKIFSDGALGARTALMVDPYENEPDNIGIAVATADHLKRQVDKAARAGLAVHIHAIGDLANRNVLDAIEFTRKAKVGLHLRHRIEHAQVLHPDDVDRFAALGVIPSMQPIHCTQDIDAANANWGERSRLAYAWSSLLSTGAHLAFGSDAPVETPDVLQGIYAAVVRRRANGYPGPDGWYPEESISVEEAVHAYTVGAAFAAGEEMVKGSITPGKLADLVVLSKDIFTSEPEAILETKIDATIVDGRVVFER